MALSDVLHPAQFATLGGEPSGGGLEEGHFTPTYSSPHMRPGGSAYGSQHPIDKALGRSYRMRSLTNVARGESPSLSQAMTEASSIMAIGHAAPKARNLQQRAEAAL